MPPEREKLGYLFLGSILLVGFSAGAYILWIQSSSNYGKSVNTQNVQSKSESEKALTDEKMQHSLASAHDSENPTFHGKDQDHSSVQLNMQIPLKQDRVISSSTQEKQATYTDWKTEDYLFPDVSQKVKSTSLEENSVCQRIEYRGEGFQKTLISPKDWQKVMNLFHQAKSNLLNWLHQAQIHDPKQFAENTVHAMQSSLKNLKILRPPYLELPELSWRGVGVLLKDSKEQNVIYLGPGMIRMFVRQSEKRSLFEMTRVVAQIWMPEELQDAKVESPWEPFLDCFELSSAAESERAWAMISGIAALASPPDCILPVFKNSEAKPCLKKLILPPKERNEK